MKDSQLTGSVQSIEYPARILSKAETVKGVEERRQARADHNDEFNEGMRATEELERKAGEDAALINLG